MNSRNGYEFTMGFLSSLSNGLPETVAEVEARLHEHERVLSEMQQLGFQLRQHRNSLTSTHRLPPEVLVLVFHYCLPEPEDVWGSSPVIYVFSWVCHYWRSAALSAPELWSAPLFSHPSFASEMLHRAHNAPLTVVEWGVEDSRVIQTLKRALQSGPRIRLLSLWAPSSTLHDLIAAFQGPALQLEDLELSVQPRERRGLYWETDGFLGDWAPRLIRLDLIGCMLDPASALYKHLTHLVIDYGKVEQSISVTSALQILAKSCSLVTLDITGISSSNELPAEKVVLLRLQHLTLAGEDVHAAVSQLLGAVDMRRPARLCFCEQGIVNVAGCTDLVRIAGSQAGITKAPPFIRLEVRIQDDITVCVEVDTQQDTNHLDLCADVDSPRLGPVLTVFCEVIPVQDLRILDVTAWTSESAPTEDEWLVVLAACPALERICVASKTVPNFVLALSSQSEEGRAANFCPQLQTLVLELIKLVEPVGDQSILAHVYGFLKARHTEGRPLRAVDFQHCYHPDSGFVQRLAPFAQIKFVGCKEDILE
jgi:hypothetical protein